jgi:hypothetical protein
MLRMIAIGLNLNYLIELNCGLKEKIKITVVYLDGNKMKPVIHHKTGNIYLLIEEIIDCTNSEKDKWMVLYQNLKGQYFVRERSEFRIKFGDLDERDVCYKERNILDEASRKEFERVKIKLADGIDEYQDHKYNTFDKTVVYIKGAVCPKCNANVYDSPSGLVCDNGHGGIVPIIHTDKEEKK